MPRVAEDLLDYLTDPETVPPAPQDIEVVAERVTGLHGQNGGATFNLYFGSAFGQRLYAVSTYIERSRTFPGRSVPLDLLRAYVQVNQDLLRDARNNVGTWYNEDQDETYVDVTTTLPSRSDALDLAVQYNQIAIYDLVGETGIRTGGTGEVIQGLPPEGERLPHLTRRGRQGDEHE